MIDAMYVTRSRSTALVVVAGMLFALAILAVAIPGIRYARTSASKGMSLTDATTRVVLPAHEKYGIYIDDTDNSGYFTSCTITEAEGQQVELRDPWWTVSSSDTETLDYVFDTASGRLNIDCSISEERVTFRPVPNLMSLLLGIVVAAALGAGGVASLVARSRSRRGQHSSAGHQQLDPVVPPPDWYPDPHDPGRLRYWDGGRWTEHVHG